MLEQWEMDVQRPGEVFTVGWTLRNVGETPSPQGVAVLLDPSARDRHSRGAKFELPPVEPGSMVQVHFDVTAPARAGSYRRRYRLGLPAEDGAFIVRDEFGPVLSVEIVVMDGADIESLKRDAAVRPRGAPAARLAAAVESSEEKRPAAPRLSYADAPFREALRQIADMGIGNQDRALALLKEGLGVEAVVARLLSEDDEQHSVALAQELQRR
jgi:hypothetical protein